MKDGERRTFYTNKMQHKHCELQGRAAIPNLVEIIITKTEGKWQGRTEYTFRSSSGERNFRDEISYGSSTCEPGYLKLVEVEKFAESCGIGTLFTRLCMNEAKIHKIKNVENFAIQQLNDDAKNIKGLFERTLTWAKKQCSKILMLEMDARPRRGASIYFKSATASKFTHMFIKTGSRDSPTMYPTTEPCCIEELKNQYDSDTGHMVKNGASIDVSWSPYTFAEWYFCFPKKKAAKCCTIM